MSNHSHYNDWPWAGQRANRTTTSVLQSVQFDSGAHPVVCLAVTWEGWPGREGYRSRQRNADVSAWQCTSTPPCTLINVINSVTVTFVWCHYYT